jgi:transcription-repair coupling factor (superfamily II helicase)
MQTLLSALSGLGEFTGILSSLDSGKTPLALGGLNNIHKAHIAAALAFASERPLFLLFPDDLEVERIASDTASFLGCESVVLPTRDLTFHNADSISREWEQKRIAALSSFSTARVIAASFEAASLRTIPHEVFCGNSFKLTPSLTASLDSLTDLLLTSGYKRSAQVEGTGQFSVRGGILDFFSPGSQAPYRIEFWGDEIDTISEFDVASQRRTTTALCAEILPAAETLPAAGKSGIQGLLDRLSELRNKQKDDSPVKRTLLRDIERLENELLFPTADRYMDLIYSSFETAVDYLPEDALVVIVDHGRVADRAKNIVWQEGQDFESLAENGLILPNHARYRRTYLEFAQSLSRYPLIYLDTFIGSSYPAPPKELLTFSAKQLPSYGGSLDTAADDISYYLKNDYSVVVVCKNELRAKHLDELLENRGIPSSLSFTLPSLPEKGRCLITLGELSSGFEYPGIKLAVISEGQFIVQSKLEKVRKKSSRERIRSYSDLTPGDYVVHEHHGVAQFKGIVSMPVDGTERDYIKLQFVGADTLYVPATQLDLVSKYIGGGEDSHVKLSKLGGTEWKRSKTKAKSAAKELAKELIELYAARKRLTGFSFPEDDDWQREFESRFEYVETDDQLTATSEIKADMQNSFPMDRLLCGDVGFGKTEVAFRAVMKCVLAGKQAAILVPTTVLAQQHFLTATRRFSGHPVNIDVMSRFRSSKQQSETLRNIRSGRCDLIIGTHRIIQKDIRFKDLGLIIIDEEQRFGVTHKEKLKELSKTVDVLTLSATPIPRTLNMALSGIRDMSSLEEAPRDRQPVQTYVLEQDNGVLIDAIKKELSRGGQVYYLHNRIESIDQTASRLKRSLDGVSIATAHGQMDQNELASVMNRMEDGEISVLVCTTIIETGIDIPNVNTLVVENADNFGLAQLHQLRGRVGRSQRRAYAYLTFRRGKTLTEIAEKRLNAIREFAEFGAGFKIAMRDLEIRGAGNILGHSQSGHMMSVGYDMYLKLLEEAVLEERGEKPKASAECTADLVVSAGISESYIEDPGQRMDLYRRIALVRSEEDASDLIDELCDRYGDIPGSVHALIRIALLRTAAGGLYINEINQREGHLNLSLGQVDIRSVSVLCADSSYKRRLFFNAGDKPYLSLRLDKKADVLGEAETLVSKLGKILANE